LEQNQPVFRFPVTEDHNGGETSAKIHIAKKCKEGSEGPRDPRRSDEQWVAGQNRERNRDIPFSLPPSTPVLNGIH